MSFDSVILLCPSLDVFGSEALPILEMNKSSLLKHLSLGGNTLELYFIKSGIFPLFLIRLLFKPSQAIRCGQSA